MPSAPLFLIVDDDNPSDQAAQLRQSFDVAHLTGSVDFANSPAEMLERLKHRTPELILLDHHWPEETVEHILGDIRRVASETRVVLFTGKKIDPSSIIECARLGIAQYLEKGALSGDLLARKLSILASNPDQTVAKLSRPSGAVEQLIQEADKNLRELEAERKARRRLEGENAALKSPLRRETIMRVIRFVSAVMYLSFVALLLWFATSRGGGGWAFGFCLLAAFGGVFLLDESVSGLMFRWGKTRLGINRRGVK